MLGTKAPRGKICCNFGRNLTRNKNCARNYPRNLTRNENYGRNFISIS